ncbi:MSHA biogenesis protein MshM [Methylophaga aminisulfidivorans MP]|uniref:MSHA biogenesis protein MshM n=1 Tax=Methylophaga aminisulfidivorans MP TaxID=1026882 RepID=F5SY05_9GAMM|nr:AAA family ATPase [Methylophaga aminisulfidivorans]EGL54073.1 MSHA biogenesis protein MshM [Methylophaga aminisulfidivorans MP]
MSDIAATSPEPAYITKLALQRLPFSEVKSAEDFFDGRYIKQRRLLILHLLRSTSTPILLQADTGLGKTTLLQQLQRQTTSDMRFYRWRNNISTLEQYQGMLKALATELASTNDEKSLANLLKERLSHLKKLNITPVLLVDDVQLLSEPEQQLLHSCLSWQDDEQQPILQAVLSMTAETKFNLVSTQWLDLPPLEFIETEAYLLHRLKSAGYQGDSPFSPKEIQYLSKASAGNLARLNALAHQQLLGIKAKTWRRTPKISLGQINWLRWSGGISLAAVIVLILVFQNRINDWISASTVSQNTLELPEDISAEDNKLATVVVGDEQEKEAKMLSEREKLEALLAEIPTPASETSSAQDQEKLMPSAEAEQVVVEAEPEEKIEKEIPTVPGPEEQIVNNENKTIAPKQVKKLEPSILDKVHDTKWILSRPAKHYTFQLMGSWDDKEVDAFIEEHGLTGDMARFTSLRDNKPWHVLIFGVYPSKQAALKASNQWSGAMNNLPTWLRRFDSVQKQIKEKGVKP